MGKGIDAARDTAPHHAALLDDFKDQLLIVLLKRLAQGGRIIIPVAEVDNTGNDIVKFSVKAMGTLNAAFEFELSKKQ